jgi:hypothetical protein
MTKIGIILDEEAHTAMKLRQAEFFLHKLDEFGRVRWEDLQSKKFDEFTYYLDAFLMAYSSIFEIMFVEYRRRDNQAEFDNWQDHTLRVGRKIYLDELIGKLIEARVITFHRKQFFFHTIVACTEDEDSEETWYEFPLEEGDELTDIRARCQEGLDKAAIIVKECEDQFEKTILT